MNEFIKNPQTKNMRAFLPLIISAVGSVYFMQLEKRINVTQIFANCISDSLGKFKNTYLSQFFSKFLRSDDAGID